MNMDMSQDKAIPELVPTFRMQWEKVQDCHVLLYPEGMIKLSSSAAAILEHINGEKTVAAIIDDLKAQFPGAELEQDVRKFMEVAHDNGWIRPKKSE